MEKQKSVRVKPSSGTETLKTRIYCNGETCKGKIPIERNLVYPSSDSKNPNLCIRCYNYGFNLWISHEKRTSKPDDKVKQILKRIGIKKEEKIKSKIENFDFSDIIGIKKEKLTCLKVYPLAFGESGRKRMVGLRCDCGNQVIKNYPLFMSGIIKSCGCARNRKPKKVEL